MRLQQFINKNNLNAKILEFDTPTLTVEQSIRVNKCQATDIIKSIIVVTNTNQFYLVLLQGNRKIKTGKLKKLLDIKDIKLASPKQVEKVTKYKIGEVPPISVKLPVIMDELIVTHNGMLYAGGGEPKKTLYISVKEMINCTTPIIADISRPSQENSLK